MGQRGRQAVLERWNWESEARALWASTRGLGPRQEGHVLRLGFETEWDYWGLLRPARWLLDAWRAILEARERPGRSYYHAMSDRDLWLIATAAELLGAHANDPALVPLARDEEERLRELVSVGVALFRSKRTLYPDTRDHLGRVGIGGVPPAWNGAAGRDLSWDVSHFYRVPVFLRSLYDTRKAKGLDFPTADEIRLVANQYVYRVFHGDPRRPLFRNFFDGRDGWYRVGYHGPDFGYPPSRQCDMRIRGRPCLTVGAVSGWGLLAPFHTDLRALQCAVIGLAARTDEDAVAFRDRYYRYNGQPFAMRGPDGTPAYPLLVWIVLSAVAEWVT